ncbi:MAG: hypothetical protein ABI972_14555 [Acidobacteriota bacterium]
MRATVLVLTAFVSAFAVHAQTKSLKLNTAAGLTLHNATAAPVKFKGKSAIKLTISPEAAEKLAVPPPPPPAGESKKGGKKGAQKKGGAAPPPPAANRVDVLALVDGVEFGNGTIEVDLTGEPGPGAEGGARGFVGVAFRVQPNRETYDCFYVRPTNGRADEQERRNHSVQYIQHPAFPWFKLRAETPSKYEAYADMMPAEWIHLKIDVDGEKAKIYVNKATQPTLLVNDVKSGASGKGAVALWIEGTTIAHYANLKITPR